MERFTFEVGDEETAQALREQAAAHGRSVEAELEALVRDTYRPQEQAAASEFPDDDWVSELIRITRPGIEGGLFEPERQQLREFDF